MGNILNGVNLMLMERTLLKARQEADRIEALCGLLVPKVVPCTFDYVDHADLLRALQNEFGRHAAQVASFRADMVG